MKFEFDLRVGDRVIHITDEADTQPEFIQKMAFYDTIPVAGPNGEAELRFSYRTPQGYEYYSIECRDAGQEFKFGQHKEARGTLPKGSLFPKTWEPILHGADYYEEGDPPPTTEPPTASAKNIPTDDELQKQAEDLVRKVAVRKENGGYTVASGNARHTVKKTAEGPVVCSCKQFTEGRKVKADFRCAHILAVKMFAGKDTTKVA